MYWGDILSLDLYQEPLNTTSVKIKTDQVQNNNSNKIIIRKMTMMKTPASFTTRLTIDIHFTFNRINKLDRPCYLFFKMVD